MQRLLISIAAGAFALAALIAPVRAADLGGPAGEVVKVASDVATARYMPFATFYAGAAHTGLDASLLGFKDGGAQFAGLAGAKLGVRAVKDKWVWGAYVMGDRREELESSPAFPGTSGGSLKYTASGNMFLGYIFAPDTSINLHGGWGWGWLGDLRAGPTTINLPEVDGPQVGFSLDRKLDRNTMIEASVFYWMPDAETTKVLGIPFETRTRDLTARVGWTIQLGGQ